MKPFKWLIAIIIILIIIAVGYLYYGTTKIAVLGYHGFTNDNSTGEFVINKDVFEKEIKYLHDHHYNSLTASDIKCYLKKECKIPRKSVLITIDDGYKSALDIAIPILNKYDMNAVIFYIGINAHKPNEMYLSKEDIEYIKSNYPNIEIASHTYNMHYPEAYLLSKEEIKEDIQKQRDVIDTNIIAYPYGLYNDTYIEALKEEDYEMAFTFGPDKKHRKVKSSDSLYEIPRFNIGADYPFWKYILKLLLP